MGKHTPGPWIVDAPGMVATNAAGAEGWEICDIRDDVPECDANAHLISAAPELLEALIMCCQSMSCVLPDFNPFDQAAYDKARAAIAKAKGDQQ